MPTWPMAFLQPSPLHYCNCLRHLLAFCREVGMEPVYAASAFLGAALVGLAADARLAIYLKERRWLRVTAFAVAFFLMAAVATGQLSM
jgi:hypothetical protein